MITHVFDTTAVLAHYFNEPGAEQVHALLADKSVGVGFAALSLLDLKARLVASVADPREAERAFRLYAGELMATIPVTRDVAELAEAILRQTDDDLSLLEAIVAATAKSAGAVLVHRDPLLARLPVSLLNQYALPFDTP